MISRPVGVVAGLGTLLLGMAGARAADAPTAREINEAIDRGVEYLKGQQGGDGSWSHPHTLGITALSGLALLESGVDREDPGILRANALIRGRVVRETHTYDLALAILFLSRMQEETPGPDDDLIRRVARRLAGGGPGGMWSYFVPLEADFDEPLAPKPYRPAAGSSGSPPPPETGSTKSKTKKATPSGRRAGRGNEGRPGPGIPFVPTMVQGDNSNTQFALLGLWVAGRHGFDADTALQALDLHFRNTQGRDGGWGYRLGDASSPPMSCAGLMGLAIWAALPKAEGVETPQERGKALDQDAAFAAGLRIVTRDVRRVGIHPDIYYLWSLERVCVALGLRELDGFDWYAAGARDLLERQRPDGSWPDSRWGSLPDTSLALLFLRKANLAYGLNREIKLPKSEPIEPPKRTYEIVAARRPPPAPQPAPARAPAPPPEPVALAVAPLPAPPPEPPPRPIADAPPPEARDVSVLVRQTDEKEFPDITVDFEVKRPDGTPVLDARPEDFGVTEYDQPVEVLRFQGPQASVPRPTSVVLVVDCSGSMERERRIDALKRAVATFLEVMPAGSRVAVIAFNSEIQLICPFTGDRKQVQTAVNRLTPIGGTRYYDAVAAALELIARESGRRAVLALSDGQDTGSRPASLDSVILAARREGLPVHTLGLGSEGRAATSTLQRLAAETRGEYFPAQEADQLRRIYGELARGLGSSYSLVYRTNRPLPDGTLRPIRIHYTTHSKAVVSSEEKAVFIRGMVVPAAGWSRLFLVLVGILAALALVPGRWARRPS